MAKNPALLVPPHRQDTAEPTQRKAFGLVSYQNRLRQIRRKHREAEDSADVRPVHVLLRRNRLHARHLAGVDQGAVVAVRPGEAADGPPQFRQPGFRKWRTVCGSRRLQATATPAISPSQLPHSIPFIPLLASRVGPMSLQAGGG